jgi:hypothetical protein
MVDCQELMDSGIAERLNKDPNLWWCVVNVDASGSGKPKAIIGAYGDTNLEGLKSCLQDDAMQFGAFKVLGVDVKGAVTSTRLKLVTFQWAGSKTSMPVKMKVKPAKNGIFSYFQGSHLNLELYDRDDLSEADIEARLRAAGGAHQPDMFTFGTGTQITNNGPAPQPDAIKTPYQTVIAASVSAVAAAAAASATPAPAPASSPVATAPAPVPAPAPAASEESESPGGRLAWPGSTKVIGVPNKVAEPAPAPAPVPAPAPAPAVAVSAAAATKEPFTFTFTLPDDKRADLLKALQSGEPVSFTIKC